MYQFVCENDQHYSLVHFIHYKVQMFFHMFCRECSTSCRLHSKRINTCVTRKPFIHRYQGVLGGLNMPCLLVAIMYESEKSVQDKIITHFMMYLALLIVRALASNKEGYSSYEWFFQWPQSWQRTSYGSCLIIPHTSSDMPQLHCSSDREGRIVSDNKVINFLKSASYKKERKIQKPPYATEVC